MCKPGSKEEGHQIAELAVNELELGVFYMKHLVHCQQEGSLEDTSNNELKSLSEQYKLEENWKITNPDTDLKPMALKESQASIAFELAKTILHGWWGSTGIPLAYVIHHEIEPKEADYDAKWGHGDSTYLNIDQELIAHDPILKNCPTRDC